MYYGGTNQETKEQRSRKIEKEEQEKWEKTTLHSKRACKKKDLIFSKECSQPSKLLAFFSRQMHQIKQWGTNLQTSMWRCHANLPCQASNNSRTVWGTMKHGCVLGLKCGCGCGCGCGIRQFLKKVGTGAARFGDKKLLKIFLFIFLIYC